MTPETLVEFGVERLRVRDYPAALAAFADAIEMDEACLPAYDARAYAYRALGQDDEAAADEAMVAELRPEAEAAARREGASAGNEFVFVGIAALLISLFLQPGPAVTVALLFAWVAYRRGQRGGATALAVAVVLRLVVLAF
jgi:tetratricopeptide (TPR) repeat protein